MSVREPGGDAEAEVEALAVELRDARRRGLDDLDLAGGRQVPVSAPVLERLARTHAGAEEGSRIPLIRRLLLDALDSWKAEGHPDEAEFVRNLFVTQDGGTPRPSSPGALKAAAQRATGLDEDAFDERRRATFRLFARYLLSFVAAEPAAAVPIPVLQTGSARQSKPRWVFAATGGAVALVALAVIVSTAGGRQGATGVPDAQTSAVSEPSTSLATFTFDALGGGSPFIRVFPGVTTSARDLVPNGTFRDRDKVQAVCKTTGRLVQSDPSVGEQPRQSDVWVQIIGSPGLEQYAPLTYGQVPETTLLELPPCPTT